VVNERGCRRGFLALSLTAAMSMGSAQSEKFKRDDPLWVDPDNLSIPEPTERPLSKTIDLFQKTFVPPKGGSRGATNINTVGEVPDSSWFTNRMSLSVSIEALVRGPDRGAGPDMTQPFLVVGAKTEGATPGLQIRDGRGDLYFLKFDPRDWPGMATSAEIIGTKFFHAFGYNVPENYLIYWRPEYEIDPEAEVLWESGQTARLSAGFVKDLLDPIPVRPDGTIQVVASKFLPGRPIGPFDFQGTRSDDPNDIFHHENRRELRAYGVFCAWLNHNDSDAVNTLDIYYTDDEAASYVKHYLIDFGTIMGSGATHPHSHRVGNEYYIEFAPALKAAASFGLWDRDWRHLDYKEYPAVGRFESTYFEPATWKPDYPNPAFAKMTSSDALWATRTVMRFSDEAIRAIVATGRIEDPEAADYLVGRIIERRDKIVRYHLGQINPLDGFEVEPASRQLTFVNLGLEAGLETECRYEYRWYRFNNASGELTALGAVTSTSVPRLSIPRAAADFLMVRLSSICPTQDKWKSIVDVYFRNGVEPGLVGLERAEPGPSALWDAR